MRHGLIAETVIDVLEDAEDYQSFEAAVIADYDAESAVERELVLRLASVLWRLRRTTAAEPLDLSILIPAARAQRLVQRVQVTAELSALRTASGSRAITVR